MNPAHLVKLVIDDEQVAQEIGEDGSEFSPWEGLPITFYMTKDTALYTMAFIKEMKNMTEECLTNEAAFLVRALVSNLPYIFPCLPHCISFILSAM